VPNFKTESFEMCCCRTMEKIIWTNRMKSEEVLRRVNEKRNILPTIKWGNLTGLGTTCLLKLIIEGQIEREIKWREDEEEGTSCYWTTCKERTRSCELKEEALDLNLWRNCSVKSKGPIVRQTKERINKCR